MRVLVFGDSLVYGRDAASGGWVQRLICDDVEKIVEHNGDKHTATYNLGIGGNTTQDVISRFEAETQARINPERPVVLVFAVGINDAKIVNGEPLSTPKQYQEDLLTLVALARNYTDKIMFVGLTPVDVENPSVRSTWTSERVKEFDDVLRKFVKKQGVAFVPLMELLQERLKEEYLLTDGLHLNDDGHMIIYEKVKPALSKLLKSKKK